MMMMGIFTLRLITAFGVVAHVLAAPSCSQNLLEECMKYNDTVTKPVIESHMELCSGLPGEIQCLKDFERTCVHSTGESQSVTDLQLGQRILQNLLSSICPVENAPKNTFTRKISSLFGIPLENSTCSQGVFEKLRDCTLANRIPDCKRIEYYWECTDDDVLRTCAKTEVFASDWLFRISYTIYNIIRRECMQF